MNKFWVCLISVLATLASVSTVFAQTTDVDYELEEVVVTAELREVNLQKVSTSIQVTSGDELRKEGKKRIDEIMQGAVGIQMQDSQNGVTFFVRGVDSGGTGGVNSTPVLVDGVAQSRLEAVRGGTLDLARAEVMRGPQSTTLGANALSGAVSLVSNKPVFNYEASTSLDVGNYHKVTMEGVMNVPLSDNQAVRIAYSSEKRDGYISNGSGESNLLNARVKYRWQPTDNLDVVGTVSHQNIGGNGVSQLTLLTYGQYKPWVPGDAYTPGSTLNSLSQCWSDTTPTHTLGPCSPAQRPLPGNLGLIDPTKSVTFIGCTPYYNGTTINTAAGLPSMLVSTLGGNPDILGGCSPSFYAADDGTNFRTRSNAWSDGTTPNAWANDPYRNSNIDQVSLEINWSTDIGNVRFLPSYQSTHYTSQEPFRAYQSMGADNYQRTKTLDVLINSNSGEKLEWQVGLFYQDDRQNNVAITTNLPGIGMGMSGSFNVGDCNIGWNGTSYTQASNGTSPIAGQVPLLNQSLCYSYQLSPRADRLQKAIFANGEYALLDNLRLIGGLRYADNSQNTFTYPIINGDINGSFQTCNGKLGIECTPLTGVSDATLSNIALDTITAASTSSTKWANTRWIHTTYRGGIEWDVRPETMLYAVYSTGSNPGAFDSMNQNTPSTIVTLEQITTGFKSQAFDNRVQFNGEAFLTTYHNKAIDGNVISAISIGASNANFATCSVGMGQTGVSQSVDGQAYCLGLGTPTVDSFKSTGIDMDLTWLLTPVDRLNLTAEFMTAQYDSAPRVVNKPLTGGVATAVANIDIYSNGSINPAYVAAVANASSLGLSWISNGPEATALAADFDKQLKDFIGSGLQNAPKFSATWSYSHNFLLQNGNRITPRITGVYKTRYWSLGGGGPGNSGVNVIAQSGRCTDLGKAADGSLICPYALAWQQAYATWDAAVAWDKADGKFSVNAYVKNLTNEVVMTGFTYQYISIGTPRTYGATFTANF